VELPTRAMSRNTLRATRELLAQAVRAATLQRPRGIATAIAPLAFVAVAAVHLLSGFIIDYLLLAPPRELYGWALGDRSFALLTALGIGGMLAALAARPPLWLRLATLLLLIGWPLQLAEALLRDVELPGLLLGGVSLSDHVFALLLAMYALAVCLQLLRWTGVEIGRARRSAGALLVSALVLLVAPVLPGSPWWWPQEAWDEADTSWQPPVRSYSAEALLYAQPERVDAAIDALAPQRPGEIDLFALGFAGDGTEGVFRNEIEHFERMIAERFGLPQRTVALVNHPDTIDARPLATLGNLRLALRGIGARMDRDEDMLLMFLTSHGSADHELHVALDDLPLDPISPQDLRTALDSAGIEWRILVVSACYSGGFIDALSSPRTLIITAARQDRPSFGCGVTSEITWFGQAFLVDGLNATLDLPAAFTQARRDIRARERERDERPSWPQLVLGDEMAERLERLRASLPEGPAVAFEPAVRAPVAAEETVSAER
jgi:hypothetical protein